MRALLLMLWLVLGCEDVPSHSYVPHLGPHELDAFGAALDEAVVVGGFSLPPPAGGPLRPDEEAAMQAGAGAGQGRERPGRRSPSFRPDRVTDLEGTLGYYEVFTPAITPFKRVTALDAITLSGETPVLTMSGGPRRAVPVEGLSAAAPDRRERDRFWGSVVLDFSEGLTLPLPSVSPESRVLVVRAEPAVQLRIEKDGADNFYVSASGTPPRNVRLTYVIDAPRDYFGGALPETRTDALAAEILPLPDRVRADALRFARELGLSPAMGVADALRALADHFRSFEESREPPRDSGNIYLDLARQKRGVCRHRAYAFVITAQALGIPSRFVQNEAHAWVEVKVPEAGWLRLDLGGAAEGLDPHATRDRPMYRPRVSDPWPRPLAYEESYSRAAELSARRSSSKLETGNSARAPFDTRLKPTLAMGQGDGRLTPVDDDREPIVLRVTRYAPEVMRGSVLEVDGAAQTSAGAAVSGLRIEVSLAEPAGDRAVLLGVSVTDVAGQFRGAFAVPPDLDPSDYALVVVTPGDAKHAAARSN